MTKNLQYTKIHVSVSRRIGTDVWNDDNIEHIRMMCEVVEYIGIRIDASAEVVDVFTMTLMYRDLMLGRTESKICKAFVIEHVV